MDTQSSSPDDLRRVAQEAAEHACRRMSGEIREAVDRGVHDALSRLGIDASRPTEVQRDMLWVREWRTTVASVRRKGLAVAVGIVVTGALGALWLGVKALLAK